MPSAWISGAGFRVHASQERDAECLDLRSGLPSACISGAGCRVLASQKRDAECLDLRISRTDCLSLEV